MQRRSGPIFNSVSFIKKRATVLLLTYIAETPDLNDGMRCCCGWVVTWSATGRKTQFQNTRFATFVIICTIMEHELITFWLRSGKHKLHGGVETGGDHCIGGTYPEIE